MQVDEPRQGGKADSQPQMEVTDEMIEAGVQAYLEWSPDTGTGDSADHRMVRDIFMAMQSRAPLAKAPQGL